MTDTSNTKLLKVCLTMFMRENPQFGIAPLSLDELKIKFEESKAKKPDEIYSVYMKALLKANPTDAEFAELRAVIEPTLQRWIIPNIREIYDALLVLKFSDEEIFSTLTYEDDSVHQRIKADWDPAKLLFVEVSWYMKKHRVTIEQAIRAELARSDKPLYVRHIREKDMFFFLSKKARTELYFHARLGLIMGIDYYRGGPDDAMIEKIANFQVAHSNQIYLETDYALKALEFSPAECFTFLEQNSNRTLIEDLHSKIQLMPTFLQQVNTSMSHNHTLEQAKAAIFNGATPLSMADFDLLLSPKKKMRLEGINPDNVVSSSTGTAGVFEKLKVDLQTVRPSSAATTALLNEIVAEMKPLSVTVIPADSRNDRVAPTSNFANVVLRQRELSDLPIRGISDRTQMLFSQMNNSDATMTLLVGVTAVGSLLLLCWKFQPVILTAPIKKVAQLFRFFCASSEEAKDEKVHSMVLTKSR